MRLLLVTDPHGARVGYVLRPPDENEREAVFQLAAVKLIVLNEFRSGSGYAERHLAKMLAGLAQRIAQRLLALTIGMIINNLVGRPPRALAAYDGQ